MCSCRMSTPCSTSTRNASGSLPLLKPPHRLSCHPTLRSSTLSSSLSSLLASSSSTPWKSPGTLRALAGLIELSTYIAFPCTSSPTLARSIIRPLAFAVARSLAPYHSVHPTHGQSELLHVTLLLYMSHLHFHFALHSLCFVSHVFSTQSPSYLLVTHARNARTQVLAFYRSSCVFPRPIALCRFVALSL